MSEYFLFLLLLLLLLLPFSLSSSLFSFLLSPFSLFLSIVRLSQTVPVYICERGKEGKGGEKREGEMRRKGGEKRGGGGEKEGREKNIALVEH